MVDVARVPDGAFGDEDQRLALVAPIDIVVAAGRHDYVRLGGYEGGNPNS